MTETRRLAFTERIPIRWGDMDAMGHVNNTVYFRYMEQSRISWVDTLIPRVAGRASGIVIVNASCTFRRPMTYPGTVEVKLLIGALGGSSVPTYYEMRVDDDPALFAEGAAVVVFIDMQKQTPIRIPDPIRRRLEALT
ncbi:MAG: acyl-CoA thioesterase [Burkholderiales bacterium]